MNFRRIYAIFIRQIFLFKSNPIRLVNMFLWLILDLLQWGFISRYLSTFGQATFSFVTVILGAIILWGFLVRIQQGTMMGFLEEVWSQNFINYFASPLKIKEYLAGLVITSITTSLVSFMAIIALAAVGFGYNFFRIGLAILPFMLVLFIFGVAIGIYVAGVIFRFGPSAEWLAWPVPFILSIVSGVYYPISSLPVILQYIAKLVPTSYVFESLRKIITPGNFTTSLSIDLFWGFFLALAYLFLMYWFFVRIYRRNLKNGSIARFNAESF